MNTLATLRTANRLVGAFAPEATARFARKLLMKPQAHRPRDWELGALERAERITFRFGLSGLRGRSIGARSGSPCPSCGTADAFDPDGDRNVAFAQHDGLTRNFKRFHAGTTLLINGASVSLHWHAAFQLHLPARISFGARFVDLTAGQLLHLRRSYSRLFKGCIDCCHAQIHSAHNFEFSQKISNRRSLGSYYPNFMHILLPLSYAFESGSSAGNNPGA